jgi:nucleotide-binding universal stress UspA family protein
MPLDLDAPRYYGTLDDILAGRGATALAAARDRRAPRRREILAAAGVEPELTSAAGEPGHKIVEVARRVKAKTIVFGEHRHASSGFRGGIATS